MASLGMNWDSPKREAVDGERHGERHDGLGDGGWGWDGLSSGEGGVYEYEEYGVIITRCGRGKAHWPETDGQVQQLACHGRNGQQPTDVGRRRTTYDDWLYTTN